MNPQKSFPNITSVLADGTEISMAVVCPVHGKLGLWNKTHGDGTHILHDYSCGCRLVVGGAINE